MQLLSLFLFCIILKVTTPLLAWSLLCGTNCHIDLSQSLHSVTTRGIVLIPDATSAITATKFGMSFAPVNCTK